ncbi:MAG: tetratricopeptide repeat protein [Aristaeellaceae bacterium]
MGLMALMKARKAATLQSKGDVQGAMTLYEEALSKGLDDMRMILAYTVLLIRNGEYQKAKDILVSKQKLPMSAEQKATLFMNYAVCCHKLGDMDRAIALLEKQHQHQPMGMIYQTLGYLYVEKFDAANKAALLPVLKAQAEQQAAEEAERAVRIARAALDAPDGQEAAPAAQPVKPVNAEEIWQAQMEAALAFLQSGVEYDDADPIVLDNMGEFYYRVLGDKEQARVWFDKAIEEKEGQIDTLWFLSRYDLEKGDKASAIARLEKALEGRFSPLNYATKEKVEQEIARLKA